NFRLFQTLKNGKPSSRKSHSAPSPWESPLPLDQFLTNYAQSVKAMLAHGRSPLTANTLRLLPSLRLIITPSAGLNHIDLQECKRRGISMAGAGDVFSDDVADMAVGLLIDLLRKISAADRYVRQGLWATKGDYTLGSKLRGKQVGIVGLGSIGLEVAVRLEAFGCNIMYNSRKKKPSVPYPFYSNVCELAANCDVLIICCALTDQTHRLINKEVLLALGKEGLIINVGRGRIIDEQDLVQCLMQGEIAGAGLDVFEKEPNVPKELLALDNVVLSPHKAVHTKETLWDICLYLDESIIYWVEEGQGHEQEQHINLHHHRQRNHLPQSPLPLHQFLATHHATTSIRAILCSGAAPITEDLLRQLPSLRLVVTASAGTNHIDLAACHRRGISVTNAGNVFSDDGADAAVGLLIDVLRKISASDRYVRRGLWASNGDYVLGSKLGGKRVGIVGLGGIGMEVAKRLEAFGCIILYNSRKKKAYVPYPFYPNVCELAANSDALIICCALTEQTRHMINKEVMLALGKGGVVVNIGRGAIVDEKEMVRCLMQGEIAGAGLDVFENEPNVPQELFQLDNVVLSPHRAVFTPESFMSLCELVVGNLEAFFSGRPLLSPVLDE
ncbi:hypothetical protein Tsubulata_040843, partial [Turnera subulata]